MGCKLDQMALTLNLHIAALEIEFGNHIMNSQHKGPAVEMRQKIFVEKCGMKNIIVGGIEQLDGIMLIATERRVTWS